MTALQIPFGLLKLWMLCGVFLVGSAASAAEGFYSGKTIRLVVGSAPGGGYDLYSRIFAKHLSRHVPGAPNIIVQNMPGAGGAKAAAYIVSVAPRDGTVVGAVTPGSIINPLVNDKMKSEYDPRQLVFLGSLNNGTMVCVTTDRSGIRKYEDALEKRTILATAGEGDTTRDYALLHRHTTAGMFDIVGGYANTTDILLAMERGEVDGICGLDWSSLKAQKLQDLYSQKLRVLVQVGLKSNKELTNMGVPEIWGYVKDAVDADVTRLVASQQVFVRPYVVPPETPAIAVADLRSAFIETTEDPKFLDDARNAKLDIELVSGSEIHDRVMMIYSASSVTLDRLRLILKP